MRKALLLLLAVAALPAAAASPYDGLWAVRRQECAERFIRFDGDGRFENRLGEETRSGRFAVQGDRLVLRADDGDEQVMPVMDHAGDRLVLFDDSVEADRRLVRCR
jgi:predicted NBD/HSP70 family sugar kinase